MAFKDPEVRRKWARNRRLKTPGIDSPRKRAWEKRNPSKLKAQKRRYYLKHRTRLLEKQKRYYAENTEACLIRMKDYAANNPEVIKSHKRKWYLKNTTSNAAKEARRRLRLSVAKTDSTAEAFYLFVRSRDRIPCYYCGKNVSGKEAHIDHVIAISRSGNHASDNLCASCPDCNTRKKDKLPSELPFGDQRLLNL